MRPFDVVAPTSIEAALEAGQGPQAHYLAGGTTQVDLMTQRVFTPGRLIGIGRLPLHDITAEDATLTAGALTSMEALAGHPVVIARLPVLRRALLAGASPQLRNAATLGGNLLQRTRCPYYRDTTSSACNRRQPGSGCAAITGNHNGHAILGTSNSCIATHPSDLAVALVALDARATIRNEQGQGELPVRDLYRLPADEPHLEHNLDRGDLITQVSIPLPAPGTRSTYLKVRARASYEFALASCAAIVEFDGDSIVEARLAVGGVATIPWRCEQAETGLTGSTLTAESIEAAAESCLAAASPLPDNRYKVALLRNTVAATLEELK